MTLKIHISIKNILFACRCQQRVQEKVWWSNAKSEGWTTQRSIKDAGKVGQGKSTTCRSNERLYGGMCKLCMWILRKYWASWDWTQRRKVWGLLAKKLNMLGKLLIPRCPCLPECVYFVEQKLNCSIDIILIATCMMNTGLCNIFYPSDWYLWIKTECIISR